jgi:hypothetical protein
VNDEHLALLQRLRVAVVSGQFPADVCAWLDAALDAFLNGQSETLCSALGLRNPGRTGHVARALVYEERNAALRVAAATLGGDAVNLLTATRRFETDTWPRVRDLPEPPDRFNETQRALFIAFKRGAPPRSLSGMKAALER